MTEPQSSLAFVHSFILPVGESRHLEDEQTPSQLFSSLTPSEYQELLFCARPRSFDRKELLFIQGQPIEGLFLLESGAVKVTQTSFDGMEVILAIYGPGETVGLPVDRRDRLHSCSAQALEACSALSWRFDHFQMLSARMPQLVANAGGILTKRLHDLEKRFIEVSTEKAERRLAMSLLRLARAFGKNLCPGVVVSISGEELAQLTAATLFTVSRSLALWDRRGLIARSRRSIVIRDLSEFEAFASQTGPKRAKRKDTLRSMD